MNNVIKIEGLDCANCARELEEELAKIEGVASVSVDFMMQKVICDCTEDALEKVKRACNNFEEVKVVEDIPAPPRGEKIKVENLCCANCARELEEELCGIDGVSATVDFINSQITIDCASAEAREKAIYAITHFEDVKIVKPDGGRKSIIKQHLTDIICISLAAILFIPAFIAEHIFQDSLLVKVCIYTAYGLAFALSGYIVLWNTVRNLAKGKIFDENFLMTVASVGAILLGVFAGEGFAEGVAVMLLYRIGELLQAIAVGASRSSISRLMQLKSETATIVENGVQRIISPDELKIGDVIMIKAGEKVAADCRIIRGESSLDTKSLNGEPIPRDVKAGDEILSGSVNLTGVLTAEVVREYKDSAVAKILELVENSTSRKSKPEKFISKFAKYYTPAVCAAALVVAALAPTVICAVNSSFTWQVYESWIYRALTFLVISCPCALVISVPLSYFCGIGRCAKFGVLVKGSTCLDSLATADCVAFDKTGTLTEGVFGVKSSSSPRALELAAAAEKFSSHPIAAAFADIPSEVGITCAEEVAGKGIKCVAEGKTLLCGNLRLLEENGVTAQPAQSVSTVIYVALGGEYVGYIEIDDKIKPEAAEAVARLKKQGVTRAVMLTGDSLVRAEKIAEEAGLDGCYAGLLPDEKLSRARQLKEGGKLIYVGDGINDAPVMTEADCAVSMGAMGSDAAIEASDVVLVSDNLSALTKGRKIARATRSIVWQNVIGSLAVKAAVMALGVAIALPLFVSVIADVGVMLIAVLNAMRTSLVK